MAKQYKRILLKISGEALKGSEDIYSKEFLNRVYQIVKKITDMGTEVAIVVGGGNIWRGNLATNLGIERTSGDYMGMLATIMNAMCLQSFFENNGLNTRVLSAVECHTSGEKRFVILKKRESSSLPEESDHPISQLTPALH